jgi:hypothetical protein
LQNQEKDWNKSFSLESHGFQVEAHQSPSKKTKNFEKSKMKKEGQKGKE